MKYTTIRELITDKISGEWGDEPCDNNSVVIIRTTNFTNIGHVDFSRKVRRTIEARKVAAKELRNGDVIIEKSGGSPTQPVGRVVYFEKPDGDTYLCNNFTAILRPNRAVVFPRFLFIALHRNHMLGKTLQFQNKTTGIINLKLDQYLESEIPLPPLQDQIRIAHLLEKVEGLIAKRKEDLAQLDVFLKSVFLEMFGDPVRNEKGWEKFLLSKLSAKITDGEHLNPEFTTKGMPIVMAGNVLESRVDIDSAKKVSIENGQRFRRKCNPDNGDILLVSRGATIGRLCLVKSTNEFCLMGSVILLKLNSSIVNPLFFTVLLKDRAMFSLLFKSSGSSAQQAIYLKDVKNLECIIPPLTLQNQFAAIVEKVERLKTQYQQSLTDLESLYGTLSQKAFAGELDLERVKV